MTRLLVGFFQHERAPVLISLWGGPLGSATLDFLEHAFELKQRPGVGRTLGVERRIEIPDRHSLFRAFVKEVHLFFPVVIDGADLGGDFSRKRTDILVLNQHGQPMQLLWREPESIAAGFAIIPFLLITNAPIGKDRQVLGVGFIQQRSLDVIVRNQEWAGSILSQGKERQQKNNSKKSESHKEKFTSGMTHHQGSKEITIRKKAGDLPPACWLKVEVTER